jgi:hypothetical protein
MQMHDEALGGMPWPNVRFGGIRLWDTRTTWNKLNPSRGVYDWTQLDAWLNLADSKGVEVLYVFGGTPPWASSAPNGPCTYHAGACYPPANLQDWDDFVRAIVTHAAGRIKYWEIWNEPNLPQYWSGGTLTMVQMAQRAYRIIKSIDPTAIVLTPSPTAGVSGISAWLNQYFSAGGGAYSDIVAFHSYPPYYVKTTPEYLTEIVSAIRRITSAYGQGSKPLWDTEASWGKADRLPNADLQAAYVTRSYILHWSLGIERFYWYAWNNLLWGSLWDPYTSAVLKPGIAYGESYKWLVGATLNRPCSITQTGVWTCTFTRPGGYEAEVVWNAAVEFPHTQPYAPSGRYVQYRDLDGNVTRFSNATIAVGSKPILLESFTAVSLSKAVLKFDPIPPGVASVPQTVVVTNAGDTPLLISTLETTGDYRQTNTCGDSLAIDAGCEVAVVFVPSQAGLRAGELRIHDNAPESPHAVALTNGTPTAPVVFSPAELSFAGQVVGTAAISKKVTLMNLSAQVLNVSGITLEGVTDGQFVISENTCARSIEANASCSIGVAFAPKTPGLHTTKLAVVDNLSPNPRIVSVAGQSWDFAVSMRNGQSLAPRSAGQVTTYDLELVPRGGFRGPVALAADCHNIAGIDSCLVSPAMVSLTGSSAISFTVTMATASTPLLAMPLIALPLLLTAIYFRKASGKTTFLRLVALVLLLSCLTGCAAVTDSSGEGSLTTRSIVVTASSRGVTRTLSLPVSLP